MPASRPIAVYLEQGPHRTFACALDWPGWCRVAKGDDAALQVLADCAPRYARVAARAGLKLPARISVRDLDVVEIVRGDATTDFGAPAVVPTIDHEPVDARTAKRDVTLLDAAWRKLDAVAAASPASLRKGPRGGGRDRDAMLAHVYEAERAYARKVGVALTADEWRTGYVELLRARLRDALCTPPVELRWPVRYMIRRTAWHALDHAWEMEDRSAP